MFERTKRRDAIAPLNVIPLIDVMLVLLAIFMVTAPIISVTEINLPVVHGGHDPSYHSGLSIRIGLDGIHFSGLHQDMDSIVTASELRGALSSYDNRDSVEVSILADEKVSYGMVMGVFSMLRSLGFVNLNLVVQDEPGS